MPREKGIFKIAEGQYEIIRTKMLNWAQPFSIFLFIDSNGHTDKYSRYACLVAAGCASAIDAAATDKLNSLQQLHDAHQDWMFGHIAYDYKNRLESKLTSRHNAVVGFDDMFFFRPQIVCYIEQGATSLVIETLSTDPTEIYNDIMNTNVPEGAYQLPEVTFSYKIDEDTYLHTIDRLRQHIADGDCYEINFCAEGFAGQVDVQPLAVFEALNDISRAPFAAFYRNDDKYMMSASPERYIRKEGDVIMSQPIKGTARRDADKAKDEQIKKELKNSIKERAENVMITDLVRNDIARSCVPGSIEVEELFGIYSFPQVHQMISTVSGQVRPGVPFTDTIRYSFPMGSMTGAPKVKVMELIDRYEQSRRGLFSGTVGYITPGGDYDFNVIIRSLFYNMSGRYLCYQAGGAITYDSDPKGELEEMKLKAWALEKIFKKS